MKTAQFVQVACPGCLSSGCAAGRVSRLKRRRRRLFLRNEFAATIVSVDHSANGPRLKIEDGRSGNATYLDPLELSALVTAAHHELAFLLDPARLASHEPVA